MATATPPVPVGPEDACPAEVDGTATTGGALVVWPWDTDDAGDEVVGGGGRVINVARPPITTKSARCLVRTLAMSERIGVISS